MKTKESKVVGLVPAFNEEKTIAQVLQVLSNHPLITKIIVVDDGSDDQTAKVASQFTKTRVIRHSKNLGKGAALTTGLKKAQEADVLVILDADLIGLKKEHLDNLIKPLLEDKAEMVLGILGQDIKRGTNLASWLFPSLSGLRALKKSCLAGLELPQGFGVDRAITKWFKEKGFRILKVEQAGLSQVMKEEKYGLRKGFRYRSKMYREIILGR